jgi:RHS repeat-associated protein
MPVNTYITANGRIRRRITTEGGTVTAQVAVVTNALGSVVATYKDGWLTADRSYDPYGETRAEWNDVGRFGWVGGLGYRETRREWVTHYVRARHYGYPMGIWTSVDPLWPSEPAFGYVEGRVTAFTDSSGEGPPSHCDRILRQSRGKTKQVSTPCGKVIVPAGLPWPLLRVDDATIRCYAHYLIRTIGAANVASCMGQVAGDLAYYFVGMQMSPVHEYDKWVHCVIGCIGGLKTPPNLASNCCTHIIAIMLELKQSRADWRDVVATQMGGDCQDHLTGFLRGCTYVSPRTRDLFCRDCCESLWEKNVLPFENPKPKNGPKPTFII